MDDYTGAYIARKNDVSVLPKHHAIAIFHLGGIAIECRLKSLLLLYHQINDWDEKSCRTKDLMCNQPIANPSHGLLTALRRMPDFAKRAKLDKQFLTHLQNILYPLGSTNVDYIKLRYIPETTQSQEDWQQSFDYICGWLEKNEGTIL